jgi:hypothetical protein
MHAFILRQVLRQGSSNRQVGGRSIRAHLIFRPQPSRCWPQATGNEKIVVAGSGERVVKPKAQVLETRTAAARGVQRDNSLGVGFGCSAALT